MYMLPKGRSAKPGKNGTSGRKDKQANTETNKPQQQQQNTNKTSRELTGRQRSKETSEQNVNIRPLGEGEGERVKGEPYTQKQTNE